MKEQMIITEATFTEFNNRVNEMLKQNWTIIIESVKIVNLSSKTAIFHCILERSIANASNYFKV